MARFTQKARHHLRRHVYACAGHQHLQLREVSQTADSPHDGGAGLVAEREAGKVQPLHLQPCQCGKPLRTSMATAMSPPGFAMPLRTSKVR